MENEADFIKYQRCLQIGTIILGVYVARDAKITQNNKFAVSL